MASTIPAERVNPDERDIFQACEVGDLDRVKLLIESEGVDQDSQTPDGNTPLHFAALKGHLQVAKYLISRDALIDVPNSTEGQTAAHWACIGGHFVVLRELFREGAELTTADNRGYNCLHHASQYGHNLTVLFCLEGGVDVNSLDKERHTALHWAAYQNRSETIVLLLKRGADIDARDAMGCTALHWAATRGNLNALEALLDADCDPSVKDNEGLTACDIAVSKRNTFVGSALSARASGGHPSLSEIRKNRQVFSTIGVLFPAVPAVALAFFSPMLASCIIGAVLAVVVWRYWRTWPRADRYPNSFYYYNYLTTYVLSIVTWAVVVMPLVSNWTMTLLFFFIFNCVFAYSFRALSSADPGTLPRTAELVKEMCTLMDSGAPSRRICARCISWQSVRAKHCFICDECVAKWDHHCAWLGRCVGQRTRHLFVLLLIAQWVVQVTFVLMCIHAMNVLSGPESLGLWGRISAWASVAPVTLFFCTYQGLVFLMTNHTLMWQIKGVIRGLTTAELAHGDHYFYLRSGNPFDRGYINNIINLFGDSTDWRYVYSLDESRRPVVTLPPTTTSAAAAAAAASVLA